MADHPLSHLEQGNLLVLGGQIGFQAGRCGAVEEQAAGFSGDVAGDCAGIVEDLAASPFFCVLLVGRLVLFVDDDQPQVGHRGKEGAAGADGDQKASLAQRSPDIIPFARGQPRVDHGHLSWKAPGEACDGLRGQGNFRDQHDGLLAPLTDVLNGTQIDFGLATSGDSVEQEGGLHGGLAEALVDQLLPDVCLF